MTHIYDWLELPNKSKEEEKVREFLDFRTRSAVYQMENERPDFRVFCEFESEKFLITGASRMGDVWLAKDFKRDHGYDKRVAIDDCSSFSYEDMA